MYKLPDLTYPYDALEPHIDARTMEIHHKKHHGGYVDKLNAALEGHEELLALDPAALLARLGEVPESMRAAVRNNGGGNFNHSFFWRVMSPAGGGVPPAGGALHEAMAKDLGGFEAFKKQFVDSALGRFGSGWAWLILSRVEGLKVLSTPNQDNPIMTGEGIPILGLDVWEHAYYLKYQNRRPEYVEAFWNIVNWEVVADNMQNALE